MKKILTVLIALALLGGAAVAEQIDLPTFLAARGLLVLGEEQLSQMGGEPLENEVDVSMMVLQTQEGSAPCIIIYQDGEMHFAMDMTNMFGSSDLNSDTVVNAFIDACGAYEVQYYGAAIPEGNYAYVADPQLLIDHADDLQTEEAVLVDSLDDLIAAVSASIK